jgi:hypothetical protein
MAETLQRRKNTIIQWCLWQLLGHYDQLEDPDVPRSEIARLYCEYTEEPNPGIGANALIMWCLWEVLYHYDQLEEPEVPEPEIAGLYCEYAELVHPGVRAAAALSVIGESERGEMITLYAPAKSGYEKEFESVDAARAQAAQLLGVALADMVEVYLDDVAYCYASQEDADADKDGAYAVGYYVTRT